jgi:sugar O-acyltransferase (sialic acid O-acetyltransferase NeuD family)
MTTSEATNTTPRGGAGTELPAPVLPRVVIVGCAGHARVVLEILESDKRCQVVGLLDTFKPITTGVQGYQVIGSDDDLPALFAANICDCVFVAVGDNWVRSQIVKRIKDLVPEAQFISAIHPSAQISPNVTIGAGTVIMAGVVVNTGCKIGEFCILNTSSSLDHDSTMGEFSSLAPRAVTGGRVEIGAFSAIAIGAVVSHATKVGEHTVIGAGATVVRSIPDLVVAYGTPARIIRKRAPGDLYLGERTYDLSSSDAQQSPANLRSRASAKMIPASSSEWTDYIERTKHDFFHRTEYHQFTESIQAGRAWLCVYGTLDKFVAWPVMIEDIESSRSGSAEPLQDISTVYGYAGPVACGCEHDRPFLLSAWQEFTGMWRSQGVVSVFTRFHPLLANHRLLPHLRDDREHLDFEHELFAEGATVAIDLRRTPEDIFRSYDRHLRQALRRLSTMEMSVTPDSEWQHLDDFVRIYHATMKRNNASPFYFFSRDYFDKLREKLGPQGTLLVTRYGDEIASIGLLIEYGSIVNVHLLGSNDRFAHASPSKLTIHEAQAWARGRGNRFLHLGGGRGSRTDDPLYRFKSMFSEQSHPFFTGRWILNRDAYHSLKTKYEGVDEARNGGASGSSFFPAYRKPI